jgi:hypothetical protein
MVQFPTALEQLTSSMVQFPTALERLTPAMVQFLLLLEQLTSAIGRRVALSLFASGGEGWGKGS